MKIELVCSYGPGRYDPEYEEKGHDYPIGFVRWTEQRNFEAILDLMASGKLNTEPLISHRFPLEKAQDAYDLILENREPYLGIILTYDESGKKTASVSLGEPTAIQKLKPKIPVAGVIGTAAVRCVFLSCSRGFSVCTSSDKATRQNLFGQALL